MLWKRDREVPQDLLAGVESGLQPPLSGSLAQRGRGGWKREDMEVRRSQEGQDSEAHPSAEVQSAHLPSPPQ